MNARSSSPRLSDFYRRWRGQERHLTNLYGTYSLQIAFSLWIVLALAISGRTIVRPESHTVFPIFSTAAQHWWSDESLYELYPGLDRFRYPPIFALFATPFGILGSTMGGIFWSWLSLAVYAVGLSCYVRDVIPASWTRQRTSCFFIFGLLGALRGLWNAQSNALMVGLLLLGTAALARAISRREASSREWWWAAFLLALPVCLKFTPLAPVLLLAALWPRQLAWRFLFVGLAISALPFLTRPPHVVVFQYREWIEHLLDSGSVRWTGFRDGWTIWIVIRHLLGIAPEEIDLGEPLQSSVYRRVQAITAVGVLVWCFWQKRCSQRFNFGPRWSIHVTLSMGLAWLMLFGPAIEHATYVFLAPPLIWAFLERHTWPFGRGLIWATFALVMFLGWGAITRLLTPLSPIALTALPVGSALFVLWLLGYTATRQPAMEDANTWIDRRESTFNPSGLRARSRRSSETAKTESALHGVEP
jgi:hypothetical protein